MEENTKVSETNAEVNGSQATQTADAPNAQSDLSELPVGDSRRREEVHPLPGWSQGR